MPGRLLLDKPVPDTMRGSVILEKVAPGVVLPEWKSGRGYVLLYHYAKHKSEKAIVFVHGGSFTGLSPSESSYEFLAQELCKRTKATVIVPDFALADKTGKHCYPQQPNEILATRMYFRDAYKHYILGSDSAGGAIAMSVLLQNSHLFDRAFFISPWLNLASDTISYKSRQYCAATGTGDRLYRGTAEEVGKEFRNVAIEYLGNRYRLKDPIANPFLAGKSLLRGLCPLFLLTGDEETIRNDTLNFAARAQQVNSSVLVSLYDGMWHDWVLYSQRSSKEMGIAGYEQIANFIGSTDVAGCGVDQSERLSVTCDIVLNAKQAN